MSKVQAQTKSVKELLTGVKYDIDFYQRGYEWKRWNVEELLNDFEAEFIANYAQEHEPWQVANYRHYFLGTIITIPESGKRYIVDGQQRLTTLTLMLIYFHHLRADNPAIPDVSRLIYEEMFMEKSFIIAVEEREDCMKALFDNNHFDATDHPDVSVRTLVERYEDIGELLPESLTDKVLPYFVSWLLHCVDIVEIEAQTDDAAFTIFETMNDRGVNLSQSDMLKGYLLANINFSNPAFMQAKKTTANEVWKKRIRELVDINASETEDFFKTWLRAKYAHTIRAPKEGATNEDFEKIDKFHRWVRDVSLDKKRANILRFELKNSQDYYEFITQRMNRFADYYISMRQAAHRLAPGWESIHYNAYNDFTLQYMLALAPLRDDDDKLTANEKIRLVATFAEIFLARRMVNFKRNGYGRLKYTMFNLTKDIRDRNLDDLREILLGYLDGMWETFDGVTNQPFLRNNFTGRSIRYLLARMTAWIEQHAGKNVSFRNYLWDNRGRPLEIEHIWANKYERHEDEYSHENDFQRERNYFGGLILLPKGSNASFGADSYEDKLKHYLEENLLAASLHPQKYEKNSDFRVFRERSELPFKPHTQFKRADLLERQELYRRICEQIWSPDRLLESS